MRTQVKICGLTRPEDAKLAARLGATHLGVVMIPGTPRAVSTDQAGRIFEAGGTGVARILLFKSAPPETILHTAGTVGTTHVQLYSVSEEDTLALERAGLTVYRVHQVRTVARSLPPLRPEPSDHRPAILDVGGGGTGRSFSWEILGRRAPRGTFIAGGIRPENIAALLKYRPYGVDLSSGVESEPGIKDPRRLGLFFEIMEKSW